MTEVLWAVVAGGAGVAAAVWGRSVRYRRRVVGQLVATSGDGDLKRLAGTALRRDVHAMVLYCVLGAMAVAALVAGTPAVVAVVAALVLVPVAVTAALGRRLVDDARLESGRSELERRAQEVLVQDQLAPRRWADRLAPEVLPRFSSLDVGHLYQPGAGLMAGDFIDVVDVGSGRVALVLGDVSGHGIDPAISAFAAKSMLRSLLRRFRDPAQSLEELNRLLADDARPDELISLFVAVVDPSADHLRYASAGHPPAWLWHDRDVAPLAATGPLLLLDPAAEIGSVERAFLPGDVMVVATDGVLEARNGDEVFGDERMATTLRRDPGAAPDVLCKSLLEAAMDFTTGHLTDDLAILAVRRS